VDLGFTEYTQPFANKTKLDVLFITLALMCGTAGLPHVIVRFYTVPNVRAARYSAFWAILFIAILYTTAPALAVFARYNLVESLHGKTPQEIMELGWTEKWQKTGLLEFEDKNGNGIIELSADPALTEVIKLDRDIVVLATPEVAKLSPWVVALVAAGGLAAALSTAAGLLLVLSSSIAHDIYFRMINPHASEGRRVFVGRAMVLVGVVVAGYFGVNPPGFVSEVVAFAFGLAAASFFPVILLGIFSARTTREGAIAGMVIGLGFTLFYIIGVQFYGMSTWCFGISAQGIGTVGMLLNFATTITVSLVTPEPPEEIRDMVQLVRMPDHPGPAIILDEGTQ
jgi:cation/acetate symporter